MISLVVTCDPLRFHLLRPFVAHYRAYGVESFYINLHFDISYPPEQFPAYTEQANALLAEQDLSIHSVYASPFDAMTIRRHHDAIQERIAAKSPWIIWADIDEFHEFPDELNKLTTFMDAHSFDHMRGGLVDRMARSGFPQFQEDVPIWKQFPLGTDITRSVLRGWVSKIMLSRAHVALTPGHHKVQFGAATNPFPDVQPVHHFKWDASVVPRLKRRLEKDWKQRCPWWVQSEKALGWIDAGASQAFAGLRVYDFEDDKLTGATGPHSTNERYFLSRALVKSGD